MNKIFGWAMKQAACLRSLRERGVDAHGMFQPRLKPITMAGLAALIAIAAWVPPAVAITVGGGGTCSINTTAVHFGLYWGSVPLVSTGSITLGCTGSNTAVRVSLNGGGSGQPTNRYLRSGAHTIAYNLYTDTGHTQIWGDGTAGTVQVNMTTGSVQVSRQVYALVPARQAPVPGIYADSVLVTVIW